MPKPGASLESLLGPRLGAQPGALLPGTALQALEAFLSRFPDDCSDGVGLELNLRHASSPADVSLCLRSALHADRLLAAAALGQDQAWRGVQAACLAWRPYAAHSELARALWLEFDASESGAFALKPGVYLQVDPQWGGVPRALWRDRLRAILAGPIAPLAGYLDVAKAADSLAAILAGVSADAALTYVGSMQSRGLTALRLIVSFRHAEQIPAFLAAAAWCGDLSAVVATSTLMRMEGQAVSLVFDVDTAILPRIGLEFGARDQYRHDWGVLLARLVAAGLCAASRSAAILDLIGGTIEFQGQGIQLVDRHLSHIKVALTPGQPTEVKGYLGFRMQRFPAPFPALA